MKTIKNCPTQYDVINTIINNIDIRGIDLNLDIYRNQFKNSVYVALCKLFNDNKKPVNSNHKQSDDINTCYHVND